MVANELLQVLTAPVNFYCYSQLFVTGAHIYSCIFSKKLTVTVSACKILVTVDFLLQALSAPVNFYCYSRLFVTGAHIYSRLFVTDSVVHLPHCVQCITIPIIKGGGVV